ncbi:MAG TPA: hypothetical protein VGG53_16780 [Mycobacterium sp.]|uniref:hypothetical protein n=1 Tax=Mycobacterium sp. TaxID=1785 RepID=UPI002F3F0018
MTSFVRKHLRRAADNVERGWPDYLFGGRVRTSTAVLVIAFLAFWWVYDDHQQTSKSTNNTQVPATQVVPPGYVPDPNYTWVPRTQVQQGPPTVTVTETPTTAPTPTTTTTPPPPTPPPLIPPIVLPPPFGPAPATTSTGPVPAPPPPNPPPLLPGLAPPPPAG